MRCGAWVVAPIQSSVDVYADRPMDSDDHRRRCDLEHVSHPK
jgi:hypothetical protein